MEEEYNMCSVPNPLTSKWYEGRNIDFFKEFGTLKLHLYNLKEKCN